MSLETVTSTEPVPPGLVANSSVAETTVTALAASRPKSTTEAPTKPVPVTVTEVPPPAGPKSGLMAVTVGAS